MDNCALQVIIPAKVERMNESTSPLPEPRGRDAAITAGIRSDPLGKPACFTLSHGKETILIEAGKAWIKLDTFRWVMRGLIEEPQSFHVHSNGSVDINGGKLLLDDPEAVARLQHEINKRHDSPAGAAKAATLNPALRPGVSPASRPQEDGKRYVHVKLDLLGHLHVEIIHGHEKVETGVRGLPMLAQQGIINQLREFHVDPLQRWVDLDGMRFECNAEGARQLEAVLESRYARKSTGGRGHVIRIRENTASPTNFDIMFAASHSGQREELHTHLGQESLDLLQDEHHCGLLKPGVVLRLAPPYLIIRRKSADGGEERVPGIEDLQVFQVKAQELERILNHPQLCTDSDPGESNAEAALAEAPSSADASMPPAIKEIRLQHHKHNRAMLWMVLVMNRPGLKEEKAFTHHNISELQHAGVFQTCMHASLSLDHCRLSVLNKQTHKDEVLNLSGDSPDDVLAQAGAMLTAALKGSSHLPNLP